MQEVQNILNEIRSSKNFKKAVTLAIGGKVAAYERLEFLGDRVLGLVIADLLYQTFPFEKEGDWAIRFTSLVKEHTLAEVSKKIAIDKELVTNEDKLRQNESILADVCEAILGVIYLEKGLEAVKRFVLPLWSPYLNEKVMSVKDFKTQLQEWSQKNKGVIPEYRVLSKTGPEHEPCFEVEVSVPDVGSAVAKGSSKKEAMVLAAKELLLKCPMGKKKKRKR